MYPQTINTLQSMQNIINPETARVGRIKVVNPEMINNDVHFTIIETAEAPTLTFHDYINNLKQFADNAGACVIENEITTDDGYKITVRREKVKK